MPKVLVDGVGIYYEEEGTGEPVLLLHGALGTGRRHFRRQAAALAPRYRVILPDTYGYGKSDRRAEFSPDFYYEDAAQMAGLLRALGIDRAHVGGFSDGAIIALCLALDFPELVHSLALAGASSYIDEPMVAELRKLTPPEALPEPLQQALARAHGDDYWRDLVRVWFAGQEADPATRGRHQSGAARRDPLSDAAYSRRGRRRDPSPSRGHHPSSRAAGRADRLAQLPRFGPKKAGSDFRTVAG